MESMDTRMKRRRLRGLVTHHNRHPSKHARRLVLRTQRWTDTPVRGLCRWCGDPSATIDLTWHLYCLDAYRVASGQKPSQLQVTMCEGCAGPADELDHRLAINVARAMDPDALRRAFTIENLCWPCLERHRRNTILDRRLARFLQVCRMDWRSSQRIRRLNRGRVGTFLAPFGIVDTGDSGAAPENIRTEA